VAATFPRKRILIYILRILYKLLIYHNTIWSRALNTRWVHYYEQAFFYYIFWHCATNDTRSRHERSGTNWQWDELFLFTHEGGGNIS
jgi:hypothetical protein